MRLSRTAGANEAEHEHLYGRNAVLEALRAGRAITRIWTAIGVSPAGLAELQAEARHLRVPVQQANRDTLDRIAGDRHHQGVVAESAPFNYRGLADLSEISAQRGEAPFYLVLDSLQDPQNFGTLLRTALAAGVHAVVIPEHRAVGITPSVSKASAGAVEHLAVARATSVPRTIHYLREAGVWVYGLAADGQRPFWEADWRGPSAVVVGAEGTGLGRLVRETCDELLRIPMLDGPIQSLNAATAGSIVLYEAYRQRRRPEA